MIIHDIRKALNLFALFILLSTSAFCQKVDPAPQFRLLGAGYGAGALGMGGAFTAVADDLSAIYWNPAGVAQLQGFQVLGDYRFPSDSDDDFASEVSPNRFESAQRFAMSGNQFEALSVSYTFTSNQYTFTPFFGWQHSPELTPKRDLKETAGAVNFISPTVFLQSEGLFQEVTDGAENEYSFGIAASPSKKILIGGSWTFLGGTPNTKLTGTYHDSFVNSAGTTRSDVTLNRSTKENFDGNYLKIGLLFFPQSPFHLGGYVRFPYTLSSNITLSQTGTAVTEGVSSPIDATATAQSEVKVPLEWSLGAAILNRGAIVSGSITEADWTDAVRTISDSTDILLIPETALAYPTLRVGAQQHSLLQWRLGTEYSKSQMGLKVRAGYFWDGQPYGVERKYFKGYTFGAGYLARGFRADFAYVSEKGDVKLTPLSSGDSHLSNRKFVVSISITSM